MEMLKLIHNTDDLRDKVNYRPVSVLFLSSKVFEQLIHNQLAEYMNSLLRKLLCGFKNIHSTQNALFKLLQ